jgi:predicted PurR-regulated permease PerM
VKQIEGLASAMDMAGAPKVAVAEGSVVGSVIAGSSNILTGLLLFVATMLSYLVTRRHLRARAIRLCLGPAARESASAFFDEIESRMAAYFGILTLINAGVGLFALMTAWFFGLPFAIVWGVVAFLFNYIPIIGPVLVAGLMFAAGLIDNGSPWAAALPAIVFYAGHLVESNVVTPLAIGRRLTLSPFMVLLSFVFWLWLWGPVGAVLSTPILLFVSLTLELLADYRNRLEESTSTPGREPQRSVSPNAASEPSGGRGVVSTSPELALDAAATG